MVAAPLPGAELSRRLFLVRHGRPVVDPSVAAAEWQLDPSTSADVERVRELLPATAVWFSSPEPKALATARLLTDEVAVEPALAEHRRAPTAWFDDPEQWRALVARVFAAPNESAHPGWEPLSATRDRLLPAVRRILGRHRGDVVLVGHGTAWTLLRSELTGRPPDLDAWARLRMPDVWVVEQPGG